MFGSTLPIWIYLASYIKANILTQRGQFLLNAYRIESLYLHLYAEHGVQKKLFETKALFESWSLMYLVTHNNVQETPSSRHGPERVESLNKNS